MQHQHLHLCNNIIFAASASATDTESPSAAVPVQDRNTTTAELGAITAIGSDGACGESDKTQHDKEQSAHRYCHRHHHRPRSLSPLTTMGMVAHPMTLMSLRTRTMRTMRRTCREKQTTALSRDSIKFPHPVDCEFPQPAHTIIINLHHASSARAYDNTNKQCENSRDRRATRRPAGGTP